MEKKFGFKKCGEYVAVPAEFIDNYAGEANPSYVVIYLCALRAADIGGSFDYEYFADKLGVKENFVKKAFDYWEKNNIIRICENSIEFLPIADVSDKHENTETDENEEATENTVPKKNFFPNYTNEDFENFCSDGSGCRTLMDMAERQLYGRQITDGERKFILALHYSFEFSLDVLAVLFNYCSSNGKTNKKYIERVAYDWYEKNIDTSEKAEDYLSRFEDINVIMRSLGMNEEPTKNEAAKIEKWLTVYGLSLDVIKKGCEKAVESTMPNNKKARFAYAEKIFAAWHKAGIRTLVDVSKAEIEYEEAKAKKRAAFAGNSEKTKKNNFTNYENQREFDPNDISERQRQLMEEILAGDG